MSSVWYVGYSMTYTITQSEWAQAGAIGNEVSWNSGNGWSIPEAALSPTQIALLHASNDFLVGQADGPRDPSARPGIPGTPPDLKPIASADWGAIENRPAVIAAGDTKSEARLAIDAVDEAYVQSVVDSIEIDPEDIVVPLGHVTGISDPGKALLTAGSAGDQRTALGAVGVDDSRLTDSRAPKIGTVVAASLAETLIVTATETIALNDTDNTIPSSAAVRQYVVSKISELIGSAPAELDTWMELVAAIQGEQSAISAINTALANRQLKDDTLVALAALTTAADRVIYATGPDQFAVTVLTAWARTLLGKANAGEAKTLLALDKVANTTDAEKPVSTATQAAIDGLASVYATQTALTTVSNALSLKAAILSVSPTVTANTALTAGAITIFDATNAALVATLPARAAANDNAVYGVQKSSLDVKANTVTITPAGSDVFDSNAATVVLRLTGELRYVQAITVGGVRSWKVIGGNTTIGSLDSRYQSFPMVRRPLSSLTVGVGDSITELGTDGLLYPPQNGESWFARLCINLRQRIRWGGVFAKGGATLIDIRDTHIPKVLAMNPLPGACIVFGGTNSMGGSHSANVGVYKEIIDKLTAVGIVPICVTIPPNDLSSGSFRPFVRQWNRWIRRFAARNGYALLDAYTALSTATGTWKTGLSDDQLHPNGAGMKAIADQGVADGIALSLYSPNQGQLTIRDTGDLTNIFNSGSLNWGLFSTASSTAGVGAGLSLAGTGSAALVAPTTAEALNGQWQRISRANTDAGQNLVQVYAFLLSGWSVGDVMSLSFRIKTANVSPNSPITVGTQITKTGGFTQNGVAVTALKQGIVNMLGDIEGTVHVEFTMPAGAEALLFNSIIIGNTSGQTVTVDIGELSVVNLTTGGALL